MKFEFNLFGRSHKLMYYSHREKSAWMHGITNRCRDGRYCLFLDYDDAPIAWIVPELRWLQQHYLIGDIHIFRSGRGYHALSTQKFSLRDLVTVMRESSTDAAYLNVPLRRACKAWTLRFSEKKGEVPQFICTLKSKHEFLQSGAHNEYLRKLYNIRIPQSCEDGETSFLTGHYRIEA